MTTTPTATRERVLTFRVTFDQLDTLKRSANAGVLPAAGRGD